MNNLKYIIAHYVNGRQQKLISTHTTFKEGLDVYEQLLRENDVIFPKKFRSFKEEYESDLVLYGFKGHALDTYTNPRGFTKPLITKGQTIRIKRIDNYLVEETFIWYTKKGKTRINIYDLFNLVDVKTNIVTIKATITTNKICFEYFENPDIDLFVLKNSLDSFRLYELLKRYCNETLNQNILFLYEPEITEKTKLYNRIERTLPVNRDYLIRPYTH